jgi:hypothetical protein
VFITENEINFLAVPAVPHSLIVFGAGHGFETLREPDWLARCWVIWQRSASARSATTHPFNLR